MTPRITSSPSRKSGIQAWTWRALTVVFMAEHSPFGAAGGAAGVLQQRQLVQLEPGPVLLALAAGQKLLPGEPAQGLGPAALLFGLEREEPVLGEGEVVLDAGSHGQFEVVFTGYLGVAGPEEVEDYQGVGPGVGQLVGELAGGVHRVDVDHRQAGQQRAVEGDNELGAVGQHDGDPVARLQAVGAGGGGEAGNGVPELGIGQLLPRNSSATLLG